MISTLLHLIFKFLLIPLVIILFLWGLLWASDAVYQKITPPTNPQMGVTFSTHYNNTLGINSEELLIAIINDLKVKNIRIPIYWDQVEKQPGQFDFQYYDQLLNHISETDIKVVLAIGYKLPRWPECFMPNWEKSYSTEQKHQDTLRYLKETVNHFKSRKELVAWQVENEPMFPFGICEEIINTSFLTREVTLVRITDNQHPIIGTDSGEYGSWIPQMRVTDQLGSSLYRKVWTTPLKMYYTPPIPPVFYTLKAKIASIFTIYPKEVFISELQAEPWTKDVSALDMPLTEQVKIFTVENFKENVEYAKKTHFKKIDLWGVEWWYWVKNQGHPEYWEYAKGLFGN